MPLASLNYSIYAGNFFQNRRVIISLEDIQIFITLGKIWLKFFIDFPFRVDYVQEKLVIASKSLQYLQIFVLPYRTFL